MLLAAFMKMNPDLQLALLGAAPSPPLILGSVTSGSILSRSSSGQHKAAQPAQREADDHVPPTVVPAPAVEEHTSTSSAMYSAPAEVTRPEAASVVPESPTNLEIDALEIGGGSDELGFSDAGASSDI